MTTGLKFVFTLCVFAAIQLTSAADTITNTPEELKTNVFRLNVAAFTQRLREITMTNLNKYPVVTNEINLTASNYFKSFGVDLSKPGRMVAFNKWLWLLFVKATPLESETIERLLQDLNRNAPQIRIKARIIEASENKMESILTDGIVISRNPDKARVAPTPETTGLRNELVMAWREANGKILTAKEMNLLQRRLDNGQGIKTIADSEGIATNVSVEINSDKLSIRVNPMLFDEFTVVLDAYGSLVNTPIVRARVWDGQTFVVVYPNSDGQNSLAVLITPTIVDQAGNRVHPNNDLPPNASVIPPQN